MSEIKTFPFTKEGVEALKLYKYGSNWPVVYILENQKEIYVGETIRAYGRTRQHMDNPDRQRLHTVHIIADDKSNKSAALDIESSLIEYMVADGKFKVQNGNGGLQNHNYYDREQYQSKFEVLWDDLRNMGLANNDWRDIKNSDLFKYSPYKTLTDDQYLAANEIIEAINNKKNEVFVVNGGPGTGKTIVATFLIKQLVDQGQTNVAVVIAMTALRNTIKKVFKSIPGLSAAMVIGPAEAAGRSYDVLLVDEAHRLRRRKNIPNYGSFDAVNKSLGLDNQGDELDWIIQSAKQVVLFYDAKQSVRPSDILPEKIKSLKTKGFTLQTQMRVKGGKEYLSFIEDLLETQINEPFVHDSYELKLFTDFSEFIAAVKYKEKQYSLSRILAGYGWEWKSKKNASQPDIEIEGHKLFWNSKLTDWVNSENAPNEVGCIHTIQGYDLNYAGVILGPEISYNPVQKEIIINKNYYKDANGHRGVSDPKELKRYVINIYKTLLTRAIMGTYIYVVDNHLREYFQTCLGQESKTVNVDSSETYKQTLSPYQELVPIPLFDSVGCGDAVYANTEPEDYVGVHASLIKSGATYFALRTRGDSMNKLGIEDGDLILCQKNYQASNGSVAVVMIGDDATLKEIQFQPDGLKLIPRSYNLIHKERVLGEYDDFKVLGTFVAKIESL